ncbi:OLC1v1027796C1 [Oldenlandia corymbosa var. corymbosa]|uniref:RING-type E3 ubiquitin transferase n=1 Tax=Oldenlandia corymbosa var. corymbosa TaxID=529605 RepID=A0AAV1CAA5_OLDCO|nr:OLC1v1027796C1 [Oldenlandia corymbosa var. corymbosa]
MANECAPVRCGESGPWIRFPFWLRDHQPETCGYPGFELTCPRINDTRFEVRFSVRASTTNLNNILLPMSVQSSVLEIDYKSQLIQVNVLNASCPPKQLQPDMSASDLTFPFEKYDSFRDNFTFFNCSTNYRKQNSNYGALVTCLSGHDYDVFAFRSYYSVFNFPIASCWKMYDISDALSEMTSPFEINDYTQVWLHWSKPSCSVCEAKGNYCMLNNNITTGEETYCLAMPGQPSQKRGRGILRFLIIASLLGIDSFITGLTKS